MKTKRLAAITLVLLLIPPIFSICVVQVQTPILTESRKSAIVTALSQSQLRKWAEYNAMIIFILKALNALDEKDVTETTFSIISQQNVNADNLTLWGWPTKFGESLTYVVNPYSIYVCLASLELVNALNQVNKEALIEMALSRYNGSDGAFREPVFKIEYLDGRIENLSFSGFPLEFYAVSDMAYAEPNIISTFLWVSILEKLNALDKINTTKTFEWILKCKADNGAFKPFPEAHPEYLPPWSSLRSNPFYVDRYGTGLAYTYAAVSALKILKNLDNSVINSEKIKEYVLACQEVTAPDMVCFKAHPDDNRITVGIGARQYTYYAIKTLENIGMLEENKSVIEKVTRYLLGYQNLYYKDSWPLPDTLWNGTWGETTWANVYGLFGGSFTPVHATYYAVLVLNSTRRLHLLDQLTPAALKTWINLTVISISVSATLTIIVLIYENMRSRRKRENIEGAEIA